MINAARLWLPAILFVVPAVLVFALFSPLIVLAAYGLDLLIGQHTGCSTVTLPAAITGWSPAAQVGVLLGQWLIGLVFILVSMWWVMSYLMLATGSEERRHNMVRASINYSTATLIALAVLIPLYGQGVCLAI